MSSSNRSAEPCDAVVTEAGQPAGPVRLPETHPAEFIEQFNRAYGALGISIQPLPPSAQRADRDAAE